MAQPGDIELRLRIKAVERTLSGLPRKVGITAVNFTNQRFRERAWINHRTEPWRQRKTGARRGKGRALLVDSGRLRRGNRIKNTTRSSVTITNNVPYAAANNNGFKGTVTVRSHSRTVQGKRIVVGAHKRNMNLPKRQFMGPSAKLDKQIKHLISDELTKALK